MIQEEQAFSYLVHKNDYLQENTLNEKFINKERLFPGVKRKRCHVNEKTGPK